MAAADIARLLVLPGLWGGSFVFIRAAVPAVGPLWLAFSRVALAFALLFGVALFQGGLPAFRARGRDFVVVGTVNSALPFALYCFAEQYVHASTAAILNATSPFFGALVVAAWLKEPLTMRRRPGRGPRVGGVVWLVGWHAEPLSEQVIAAAFACLAAALCYGVAGVYIKVRMSGVPSSTIALYSQFTAAIVLAPAAVATPVPAHMSTL